MLLIAFSIPARVAHGADVVPTPEQVDQALAIASDGYSTDEVILQPALRTLFLREIRLRLGNSKEGLGDAVTERELLLTMLKYRKAGKLEHRSHQRHRSSDTDAYRVVAELAGRTVMDRHRVTSDTLICDPLLRREFIDLVHEIGVSKDVDEAAALRALVRLRKQRRLRPELVLQVADWPREVVSLSLAELKDRLQSDQVPDSPGIYMFHDATGYLYIGEAKALDSRLATHLDRSDRESLMHYLERSDEGSIQVELHVFAKDSPAKKVAIRRAYESELIRSRNPRLNVRP